MVFLPQKSTFKNIEQKLLHFFILLMVQKSGSHQLRLLVYPMIYRVLAPSQVVLWDFWTINSMSSHGFSPTEAGKQQVYEFCLPLQLWTCSSPYSLRLVCPIVSCFRWERTTKQYGNQRATGQNCPKQQNKYDLWWNRMFGRLVDLARLRKALFCWKKSQLGRNSDKQRRSRPLTELHLWNEVQPMSPLSLNHDHLFRS